MLGTYGNFRRAKRIHFKQQIVKEIRKKLKKAHLSKLYARNAQRMLKIWKKNAQAILFTLFRQRTE